MAEDRPAGPGAAAVGLAGLLSLAVAMGFGRFSFTPMLPLMIQDGQADLASGGWIAAANYVGYLLGALTAAPMAAHPTRMARLALGLTALLLAAMALPLGSWGWAAVRLLAGAASAWAFVATSVWCLGALAQRVLASPAPADVRADARATAWSSGLYAGVGIGITLTGLYCLGAAAAGASASALWLQLAVLAAVLLGPVAWVLRRLDVMNEASATIAPPAAAHTGAAIPPAAGVGVGANVVGPAAGAAAASGTSPAAASLRSPAMLPLATGYALFGFGYILPATFLPALARNLVPDPRLFGLAWPLWGVAAVLSVLLSLWWLRRASRLQVWSVTQALMGVGALAPSLWLSGWTIGLSAVLVGGTFMVMTLTAVQEARIRGGVQVLPRMTAVFAIGQIVGPVIPNALMDMAGLDATRAMNVSLRLAAFGLLASALWLWRADRVASPRANS